MPDLLERFPYVKISCQIHSFSAFAAPCILNERFFFKLFSATDFFKQGLCLSCLFICLCSNKQPGSGFRAIFNGEKGLLLLKSGIQCRIVRKPRVHGVEVMGDAGINTLPGVLGAIENHYQPGALPVTQEDSTAMANAVEGQEAGVAEQLPEQAFRHVLHHHPVSQTGMPKLPHADALRDKVWPPDMTTVGSFTNECC
jgi:hypothetical protein